LEALTARIPKKNPYLLKIRPFKAKSVLSENIP